VTYLNVQPQPVPAGTEEKPRQNILTTPSDFKYKNCFMMLIIMQDHD
jgi:hypothetical protein